ncbi:DUF3179 domain-containing protein [Fischerella thermalis]|uniref:DUF3179 domain-containing protein n=1 Tax=Fischerella thermalis CCMEE 5318 TaxID=2019666 RepID=A0A2N6LKX9_9CYAN|nr:DUF3179 domain-containing protein [Fischerella thermalis]PMB25558.1 hypothetical protein CEN46_05410 [Fischerella thermalis CCMEE 5318]
MKRNIQLLLSSISIVGLLLSTLVVQAGGLDDFKLRYFSLSKHLHDQNKELNDLRKQNIDPAKNTRINLTELLDGGPPKDGIPSIDNPRFDTAKTTPFKQNELVIGVVINGEAKAYPLGILNWHEIVNDTVGGTNLSVTYCPLCDTGIVFERGNTTYGVSGKLYQSCLVMYDRADDTLYSQPWGVGVVGPKNNRSLKRLPGVKTTIAAWLAKHPNSKILSTETGHKRDYLRYPYGSYYTNNEILFPVRNQNQRQLHPKAIVSYVWEADNQTPKNRFSGVSHQFSHQELEKVGQKVVDFNGRKIKAIWDKELKTVLVKELDGKQIPSSTAFAFVYPAFFGK